jgi:hypothetical protein
VLVASGQTPTPVEQGVTHRATVLTRIEDGQRSAPDGTIVYFVRVLPPRQTQPVIPADPMYILCGSATVTGGVAEFTPVINADCPSGARITLEVKFPDERPPIVSEATPPLEWRPARQGETAVRTLTITPIPPSTAGDAAEPGVQALPAVGSGDEAREGSAPVAILGLVLFAGLAWVGAVALRRKAGRAA